MDIREYSEGIRKGDKRLLARAISMVENATPGYEELLRNLAFSPDIPVVGFTGPPGAGKSTLINALISLLTASGKSVGVVAVDPTSPFHSGALLGDRIRMSDHFESDLVFIRSLASRRSLGGLSAKTLEVVDVMRAFPFDYIFVETVGVGQSEVEIAGLADTTVLVLVPEAGDDIQAIKSGIMEIADVFVVNKSDREGAGVFAKHLVELVHERFHGAWAPPVIQSTAIKGVGCQEILEAIGSHRRMKRDDHTVALYAEKAWRIIQENRMKDVNAEELRQKVRDAVSKGPVNIYALVEAWGY
ncbi:MAG: methylmalonyl Co-A mutase-associated GTPase MeaB [Flavobacteriales bacterium]|nr:methylmalonyl Co-A mutase-associated GTPase MeaB [Flavobacteriales bacterium]MCB9446761.1 methylmalonyl Co-A mutase-associated GTPase MeaB [Flavobacteriales bacterium]